MQPWALPLEEARANFYDAFLSALLAEVAKITVGDGQTEPVTMGPMVNAKIFGNAFGQIADARAKGARICCGGDRLTGGLYDGGYFLPPTVIADTDHSMQIMTEETFGPLAPLFKFDTEEEVIAKANDTVFGLASYFYARDIGRITRVQEALEYGMVGVNTGLISTEVAPFGGVKQSGLGREGSRHGMEDYLEMKYICLSV